MQDRIKSLQGVLNFRDFGGYTGADGAKVATGRLFRSAHFAEATDQDAAALDALNVRVMVDLRRPEEREMEPNRWPGAGVRVITNDEGLVVQPAHVAALEQGDWSVAGVKAYMQGAYAGYPFEARYVALFGEFLRDLAKVEGAGLVHCAAGKDRTGCLCALTLTILGVPEEAIIADYELTNVAFDVEARLPQMRARIAERAGAAPSDEALRVMLGVRADYLATYFATLHARYPNLTDYLDEVLGVDAATQEAIRARLLV